MPGTEDQWDEIELPDIIKDWETGDSQEGFYQGQQEIKHVDGDFTALIFKREDGTMWSTGGSAGLLPLFRDVPVGKYVRVEMTGEKDTGRPSPMKEFKVLVRR